MPKEKKKEMPPSRGSGDKLVTCRRRHLKEGTLLFNCPSCTLTVLVCPPSYCLCENRTLWATSDSNPWLHIRFIWTLKKCKTRERPPRPIKDRNIWALPWCKYCLCDSNMSPGLRTMSLIIDRKAEKFPNIFLKTFNEHYMDEKPEAQKHEAIFSGLYS